MFQPGPIWEWNKRIFETQERWESLSVNFVQNRVLNLEYLLITKEWRITVTVLQNYNPLGEPPTVCLSVVELYSPVANALLILHC